MQAQLEEKIKRIRKKLKRQLSQSSVCPHCGNPAANHYCPSPEEITEMCAKIRSRWSASEERSRMTGPAIDQNPVIPSLYWKSFGKRNGRTIVPAGAQHV